MTDARLDYVRALAESPIELRLAIALTESHRFVVGTEAPSGRYEVGFVMQYPAGRYRIDMALFLRTLAGDLVKIAVECDGKRFHTGAAYETRDQKRDAALTEAGFLVWRYPGWLLHYSAETAADEIQAACEALINGAEPILTFSRGRADAPPTLRELEMAFHAFQDGVPWPDRMGPSPAERGWLCPEDIEIEPCASPSNPSQP